MSSGFLAALTRVWAHLQNSTPPVKRRRALLASNPPRNSRWEAHRSDEQRGEATLAPPPGRYDRFPMPAKTPGRSSSPPSLPLRNFTLETKHLPGVSRLSSSPRGGCGGPGAGSHGQCPPVRGLFRRKTNPKSIHCRQIMITAESSFENFSCQAVSMKRCTVGT